MGNKKEKPIIADKSDHDSDGSVKSKHSKKRKRSKPDRETTAYVNKKRKNRSKKRRYDTDSSSELDSDVVSLHSKTADEERSVISETLSRKTFLGDSHSQSSHASTSNFSRFNPHKKEKVGPVLFGRYERIH